MGTVTREELTALLVKCNAIYPRKEPLSRVGFDEYFQSMRHCNYTHLCEAFESLKSIKKNPFFPVPGELLEFYREPKKAVAY